MTDKQAQKIQLFRAQKDNRKALVQAIQSARGNNDIQQYQVAYRELYFNEGLFQARKSKDALQKYLQQLNPSLHYSQQTQLMLKNVAKIFLIQLFEKSIELRQKMINKKQIDEEVLEEAYRIMKKG